MGQISKDELKKLFSAVDQRLTKSLDLFIIGGASAILGYNVAKETNDVDVDGHVDPDLNQIFQEEAAKLNLDLHLASKGVFSPPDHYRERMKFEIFQKKKLRVWYLDQYDLAISKIDRGIFYLRDWKAQLIFLSNKYLTPAAGLSVVVFETAGVGSEERLCLRKISP